MNKNNTNYFEILSQKLINKSAVIGIFGLGYVGLPLAINFSKNGFRVIGFDIDLQKVNSINSGKSYIEQISDYKIDEANQSGFKASNNFDDIKHLDALIICVPTPLKGNYEPDLSYVEDTAEMIVPHLKHGQVISLESTTYPGTTEEILKPILTKTGLSIGEDIFLVYSPEREDPGNVHFNTATTPKIISGITDKCLKVSKLLYSQVVTEVIPTSSTQTAEFTKLLENIYRAVNIALVNEMKIVADSMNIDIHEVVKAASTKPFGFSAFYPGPGFGGHCIPIDPFYLTWKAKQHGTNTKFIELAGKINRKIPFWIIDKLIQALRKNKKNIKGANILLLGLAYKKDVGDMRESPTFKFLEILNKLGAKADYSDPFFPTLNKSRHYNFCLKSVDITPKALERYDGVIIITDHSSFNYDLILKHSKLVIDSRGIIKGNYNNLIKA